MRLIPPVVENIKTAKISVSQMGTFSFRWTDDTHVPYNDTMSVDFYPERIISLTTNDINRGIRLASSLNAGQFPPTVGESHDAIVVGPKLSAGIALAFEIPFKFGPAPMSNQTTVSRKLARALWNILTSLQDHTVTVSETKESSVRTIMQENPINYALTA